MVTGRQIHAAPMALAEPGKQVCIEVAQDNSCCCNESNNQSVLSTQIGRLSRVLSG